VDAVAQTAGMNASIIDDADPTNAASVVEVGRQAYALIEQLYPFSRSLTGEGVRKTLRVLQSIIPLTVHEVPSGTRVYDWTVPDEWNIDDAYVMTGSGHRLIDFHASNLHVVAYSSPVDARMSHAELIKHIHTDSAHPDWTPYRHTFYRDSWGFCAPHRLLSELNEQEYQVRIDSSLAPGSLTYGELFLPGSEADEILISTHTCHPSLCNDNLSGIAVAALLARELRDRPRRLGIRFVFVPATLGPLVWLSRNEHLLPRIRAGLVLAGIGDPGPPTYTRSRHGSAPIDRAMVHVLAHSASNAQVREFAPVGYDQRQYCSPGFNLPIGGFNRTPNGEYVQYHTSADNLELVTAEALGDSSNLIMQAVEVLQENRLFLNLSPKGEPRLGPRGLFDEAELFGLFWILNFSDGHHSLLDIAERARLPFWRLREGARRLRASGLLQELPESDRANEEAGVRHGR
jgi:aminopeptidase-like protein